MPVWLWPVVFLCPFLLLTIYGLENERAEPQYHREYLVTTLSFAFIPSVGLASGLALSCRFYDGWAARILGTVVFGFLMTIAAAAIVFAGCICTNNIYIR